jgi:hypothetical protein
MSACRCTRDLWHGCCHWLRAAVLEAAVWGKEGLQGEGGPHPRGGQTMSLESFMIACTARELAVDV